MGRIVDLTGKAFGDWQVLGLAENRDGVLYWHCQCLCGARRPVFGGDLKRGGSLGCGCAADARMAEARRSHDLSRHPAYRSWIYLRARCENEANDGYEQYGGRGIRVCDRWSSSFEAFWADMGPTWARGLSIDRIDVNGDYEPGNCRWATARQQSLNRRTNKFIETPLGRMTITEAAEAFGIKPVTLHSRVRLGWKADRLFTAADPHRPRPEASRVRTKRAPARHIESQGQRG